MAAKPRKNIADELLLDQALQFIVEAPDEHFLEYVKESADKSEDLENETERALTNAINTRGKITYGSDAQENEAKLTIMEKAHFYLVKKGGIANIQNESFVNWTNQSVLKFAGKKDPVVAMSMKMEGLTLRALEQGWSGPPYDPFKLAGLLGIKVLPRDDLTEARIVRGPYGKALIEFNSRQPPSRVRFSIAHEITHTLFPDCFERARYRARRSAYRKDDWQLEMLCNIGAAEILMPTGSFSKLRNEEPDINHLMDLRKIFEVSAEAILIRVARLSKLSIASFAASTREDAQLQVDYTVFSRAWFPRIRELIVLPNRSVLNECSAIGFTAKNVEIWKIDGKATELEVQAVGLPPYPGTSQVRVAGLIRPGSLRSTKVPTVEHLFGDALQPRNEGKKVVAHVVNDQTPRWGGSGFASYVKKKWPDVQDDFKSWAESKKEQFRLGAVHVSTHSPDISVMSMVAQRGYGPSESPRIRYTVLEKCLEELANYAIEEGRSIHMPKIGTGYGGGDWDVIEELIDKQICSRGLSVLIYRLPR